MSNLISLRNLYKSVPSIFTDTGSNQTSGRYQHISTANIVKSLFDEGFVTTWAAQCRTRDASNKAFTKHMLRFRHADARPNASGLYSEIVLINSHDGLSSYRLLSGIYRVVCSNGLIAGDTYEEVRVRHQGDILEEVIKGTRRVIENSQKMIESAVTMSGITLNNQEKNVFAEAAHGIRFQGTSLSRAIEPLRLLSPRRHQEVNKNDLFTIFNIVQENVIKGGIRGYSKDANGYEKRVRTRAIKSIDQNTALNQALWALAEETKELKRA